MAKITGTHRNGKNFVGFGSINFPKLMKHVGYRTNQVRDLIFERPEKYPKSTASRKRDATVSDSIQGPRVDFGYEKGTDFTTNRTRFFTDTANDKDAHANDEQWYQSTPALSLTGLKAVQNPIVSRGGTSERGGFRTTGECIFYMPSLSYIQQLPNFKNVRQFTDIEVYDKFIDQEHIIIGGDYTEDTQNAPYYGISEFDPIAHLTAHNRETNQRLYFYNNDGVKSGTAPFYMAGHDIDRIQLKVRCHSYSHANAKPFINAVGFHPAGNQAGLSLTMKGSGTVTKEEGVPLPLSGTVGIDVPERGDWVTLDFPFNKGHDTSTSYFHTGGTVGQIDSNLHNIWVDGTDTYYPFYLANLMFDGAGGDLAFILEEVDGNVDRYLSYINVECANGSTAQNSSEVKIEIDPLSVKLYKQAEWRVESIKDYRDEYMEVHCTRVRGERPSMRRTYGGRPTKQ